MSIVDKLNWAMSLREPQLEALKTLDNICSKIDYKTYSKEQAEEIATENCQTQSKIKVDDNLGFPSFCFEMTTGIGKTRLMGASIYYLYKTKGYKHFFILAPGNTIYDKLRKEVMPHHPKYMFKGLEAEMGRPKVYDGENYLSYPVKYVQGEIEIDNSSEIQIFIFNIGKIFNRGDVQFKFHEFQEALGKSFAEVLASFDDLVICMDEAHRYYAPASMKAIDYLKPILGLEFTATPKSTNKNIIYSYGLAEGAGKFLKIPVVMGRTNTAGFTEKDIEEMKIKDGIKLHEHRKATVYKYCSENGLPQVKPIVLISCKDTNHAMEIRQLIDSDSFFDGKYKGRVIEIHSKTGSVETEDNIKKLLTIEENTNPIEIVLHVYKLKEGWDVNNLFTIIPLNAAKSEILALQTIGRGLRLPFGKITGQEELDTLDIVAHDHYRELVDEIKLNPVFKKRNLDEEEIEQTETVEIEPELNNVQLELFEKAISYTDMKSFQDISDIRIQEDLYKGYLKTYAKEVKAKDNSDIQQMTLFELEKTVEEKIDENSKEAFEELSKTKDKAKITKTPILKKDEFIEKINKLKQFAISVPKISIGYSSTVKFKPITVKKVINNFELEQSYIERYDVINNKLLETLEAVALEIDDPVNELACMLLESVPEFSSEDADYILNIVEQYLKLIEGSYEDKKKIVRRYATLIVNEIKKQIYAAKEEHTEFIYRIEKDLIIFKPFVKNIKPGGSVDFYKDIKDKKNIRQYLFTGYKKSYYPEYGFDSDDERRFSVILEEDKKVLRWIKPPLNQMGLFYKAGKQYNPDFILETTDSKYLIEIKAKNETEDKDVLEKAKAAIKWCKCATEVDADKKQWNYRLIAGDKVIIGNSFMYTVGLSENLEGIENE
ncbi:MULTISPECIES: DEAD/DEAH box helicase family protein [unclassified Clostridium]|uniref:DEAD/DEAH box helicase n=1 Tax=unclassified Clostridium TaxID=2614128 RepID=UPI0002978ED2|nr:MULTISPECIES: DEAD/DEAH box helicase family protein [unclassified Clostridium]EKQ55180.1 MAG: restriction endonuclease [Clostridium sp. Maddingley MBC34-26]